MFPRSTEKDDHDPKESLDLKQDKQSLLAPDSSASTEVDGFTYELRDQRYHKQRRRHLIHLAVLYTITILVSAGLVMMSLRKEKDPGIAVYSPAKPAVAYTTTKFAPSEYYGPPTTKRDKLWEDLYHRGVITRISGEEAKHLAVNNSYQMPNGDHVIQLEMFHQLHCINTLRRSIYRVEYPQYSPYTPEGEPDHVMMRHLDHCVDRIRQGIMCHANVGTAAWEKHAGSPKDGGSFESWLQLNHHPVMTCRNFHEVQEWAFARELEGWHERDSGEEGVKIEE